MTKRAMERTQRTRTEIIATILQAAIGGGAKMQKLQYSAYMSYGMLKEYLAVLIESGLVKQDSKTRTFQTTPEGVEFLKTHSRLVELMKVKS